ncbi:MAG: hypothetical protein JRH18_24990, partial [Deltaproteobacteria bacterium]|nr:hypothetical protein [Deltaproteobacteria bacterium]
MDRRFSTIIVVAIVLLTTITSGAYEIINSAGHNPVLAPLENGQIKILSIALYPAHYHSVELAKRLDCEIVTIRLDSAFQAGYNKDGFERKTVYWRELQITQDEMTEDALNALKKDYDIIIIGVRPVWSRYPEKVQKAILDKAESGTALLIFSPEKTLGDELAKMQKVDLQLNTFAGIKEKTAFREQYYRLGKGIIGVMEAPIDNRLGYLISDSDIKLYEEYKYRRIANLIYKFSKNIKQPKLIKAEQTGNKEIELSVEDVTSAMSLKYRLVDENYNLIEERSLAAKSRDGKIKVKLPQLQNGEYAVEFELSSDGKLVDWISGIFKVEYNPEIVSATLKKDTLSASDMINLTLSYSDDAKGLSL